MFVRGKGDTGRVELADTRSNADLYSGFMDVKSDKSSRVRCLSSSSMIKVIYRRNGFRRAGHMRLKHPDIDPITDERAYRGDFKSSSYMPLSLYMMKPMIAR
jgi:hypothetical protein